MPQLLSVVPLGSAAFAGTVCPPAMQVASVAALPRSRT